MPVYQYPPTPAGREITEAMLQAGLPTTVEKVDVNGRTVIALSTDPDLQITVPANTRWWVEMDLMVSGLAAAKIQTMWAVPTGVTGVRRCVGPSSTAASQTDADGVTGRYGAHGFNTGVIYALPRNSVSLYSSVRETGIVAVGASSGILGLQWAQAVVNATATFVQPGSVMRLTQLA